MKPSQKKWLSKIGKYGKLAFHLGPRSDQIALNALLKEKLIVIEAEFEGGLYRVAITDAGRAALSAPSTDAKVR